MLQGIKYLKRKGRGSEYAYKMSFATYLKAVEGIFARVKRLAEEDNVYTASALLIRFVKESKCFIAPEYQQTSAYISNPVLMEQKDKDVLIKAFQETLLSFGGKPHWGKITDIIEGNPKRLHEMYPGLKVWLKVMKSETFNKKGTFSNGFSDRMGLPTE